jgi:energy-coupling factor transporter ATP-binding protein EcfA2
VVALYGRKAIVDDVAALMLRGQTVLLYGPMGIGKTAILEAVRQAVEKEHRPGGFSAQTRLLSDLTAALLQAYPAVTIEGRTQRQIRSTLRLAVENNPAVLLLDHIHEAGTQFKGYLRSLRGIGLGVLFAADVEVPRDHESFRSMHLAYREMEVPPLPSRYLRRILENLLAEKSLPYPLTDADRSALLKAAHGRPGWMLMIGDLLQSADYWSCGRVHVESMQADIMIKINKRYFLSTEGS